MLNLRSLLYLVIGAAELCGFILSMIWIHQSNSDCIIPEFTKIALPSAFLCSIFFYILCYKNERKYVSNRETLMLPIMVRDPEIRTSSSGCEKYELLAFFLFAFGMFSPFFSSWEMGSNFPSMCDTMQNIAILSLVKLAINSISACITLCCPITHDYSCSVECDTLSIT